MLFHALDEALRGADDAALTDRHAERAAVFEYEAGAARPDATARALSRLLAARRAHGMAEAARLTVTRSRREAVPLSDVTESRPEALLSVLRDGRPDGALLSVGTVAVLAGAGGVAKSTLVAAAPALRALQCRYRIVSGFRGSVGLAYGVASCIGSVIPALRAGG